MAPKPDGSILCAVDEIVLDIATTKEIGTPPVGIQVTIVLRVGSTHGIHGITPLVRL